MAFENVRHVVISSVLKLERFNLECDLFENNVLDLRFTCVFRHLNSLHEEVGLRREDL